MIPFNDTFTQEEEMFSQEKKRGTKFLGKRCKSWEQKQEKRLKKKQKCPPNTFIFSNLFSASLHLS